VQSVLETPVIGDAADRARVVEAEFEEEVATPTEPRELTAAIRKRLGLPVAKVPPYRFAFIGLCLALIGVPMLMLGWWKATFALVFVSLVLLPAVRWWEKREIDLRDRVYTHGVEVIGRVLDVEPGGPDRNGKIVRLEFQIGTQRIAASVFGCPLTRKGLDPGDDVVVYYAEEEPQRCLIVEKIARKVSAKPRKIVPRPTGGCGKASCGTGGCDKEACGTGGCGTGGCC
jgi:hypothetical protein